VVGIELGEHPVHQCRKVCVAEWGVRDAWYAHEKLSSALNVKKTGDLVRKSRDRVAGARPVDAMTALTLEHPGEPIPRIVIGKHGR